MTRPTMYAPTAAYRVGRATENKARAVLHRAGFVTVRSWMSRSPADIVAMRAGKDGPDDGCLFPTPDGDTCGLKKRYHFLDHHAFYAPPTPLTLLLIQVKKGGTMTPAERVALIEMAVKAGGVPVLCRMESDGSLTFHTLTGIGPRDLELMEDIV